MTETKGERRGKSVRYAKELRRPAPETPHYGASAHPPIAPLSLLCALPYLDAGMLRELTLAKAAGARILIDSGAFTAFQAGTRIELDDYLRVLDTLPFTPDAYFVLDVVGSERETDVNYHEMLRRGYTPAPIFQRGVPYERLEDMFATAPQGWVGIAGLTSSTTNAMAYLKRVMRHVGARPVHWLGFARASWIEHYRPLSFDASTWETASRYGVLRVYSGRGKFVKISRDNFRERPPRELVDLLHRYEIEPREMRLEQNWRGAYGLGRVLNLRSYVRFHADIEHQLGTRAYLAVSTTIMVKHLVAWAQAEARHAPTYAVERREEVSA